MEHHGSRQIGGNLDDSVGSRPPALPRYRPNPLAVSLTRKGIGLVEVMVAMALTGLLAALLATILAGSAAQVRDRSERIAAEHSLRVAGNAVRAVLESAQAGGSDLALIAPSGFLARVTRGGGVLCQWTGSDLVVRRSPFWWNVVREPSGGRDSLLVGKLTEPGWIAVALRADPRSTPCPDGSPGLALAASLDPTGAGAIGPGSPVRFFEPVEVRLYTSSGSDWVGLRLVATGEAIQPLAGPLARTGWGFEYLTRDGGVTLVPGEVASVGFRIAAFIERGGRSDSVQGFVALREGGGEGGR